MGPYRNNNPFPCKRCGPCGSWAVPRHFSWLGYEGVERFPATQQGIVTR